jgi:hypothetical protein
MAAIASTIAELSIDHSSSPNIRRQAVDFSAPRPKPGLPPAAGAFSLR